MEDETVQKTQKSVERIRVVMDDREPRDLMTQAMVSLECFDVEVQHLSIGDYLIDDALLVERKTVLDLALDYRWSIISSGFAPGRGKVSRSVDTRRHSARFARMQYALGSDSRRISHSHVVYGVAHIA